MIDKYCREITKLRVSITSDCNLNCSYCHREGNKNGGSHSYLTLDQIKQICTLIQKHNINYIKITGGEPLLHPDIIEIVKNFAAQPSVTDLSVTTNGLFLKKYALELKKAGLNRLNIGCDTLEGDYVKTITKIQDGLTAVKNAGFDSIKLNMVLLKGINEHEIEKMIDYVRKNGFILQIIELIDTDEEYFQKYHVSMDKIESFMENKAIKIETRNMQARKRYFLDDDTIVEIVRPMHNPNFCSNCHTMRITNDYQFQPCLNVETNFVPIDGNIEEALLIAMDRRKPYYTHSVSSSPISESKAIKNN